MSTLDLLESTLTRVRVLVSGLTEEQLSFKPPDAEFSLRENVAHLRDIDVEGYERRVALILSSSHPHLPDVNGAQLARERDYAHQPLASALAAFEQSRRSSLDRLRSASPSDFERTGEMEGVGSVTLARLLELWAAHDAGHLAEMERLRAGVG